MLWEIAQFSVNFLSEFKFLAVQIAKALFKYLVGKIFKGKEQLLPLFPG